MLPLIHNALATAGRFYRWIGLALIRWPLESVWSSVNWTLIRCYVAAPFSMCKIIYRQQQAALGYKTTEQLNKKRLANIRKWQWQWKECGTFQMVIHIKEHGSVFQKCFFRKHTFAMRLMEKTHSFLHYRVTFSLWQLIWGSDVFHLNDRYRCTLFYLRWNISWGESCKSN